MQMLDRRPVHPKLLPLLACAIAAIVLTPSSAAAQDAGKRGDGSKSGASVGGSDNAADATNPIVQLVNDPGVQKELGLSTAQTAKINDAYAKVRTRLWLLRDVGTGPAAAEKGELLASFESALPTLLEPAQRERLDQLVVRARGWQGITAEPAASRLQLSADQKAKITAINQRTLEEIQKIGSSNDSPAARQKAMQEVRTAEGTEIQNLLSNEQRLTLRTLVGAPYDLSRVQPLSYQAPELAEVDAWINTEPLDMPDLRGRVVAYHFWAFGCINCIHNLPHYDKWHDELASEGLVVLGMHTPETPAERSVDNLRAKVDEYGIKYPVAVDHDNANWKAWGNSWWPSVYLVDKNGRVRYWWYGELNWQGAKGEAFMRQKIKELLAE